MATPIRPGWNEPTGDPLVDAHFPLIEAPVHQAALCVTCGCLVAVNYKRKHAETHPPCPTLAYTDI